VKSRLYAIAEGRLDAEGRLVIVKPTAASRRRRVEAKRRQSTKKQNRRGRDEDY